MGKMLPGMQFGLQPGVKAVVSNQRTCIGMQPGADVAVGLLSGVVVRRPEPTNFNISVETPDWRIPHQNACSCPRDTLLVLGNEIIEAPMSWRSRFFEWKSQRYGHLTLSNGRAALNFTLPGISGESVSLSADLSDAVLWGRRRQSEHGPEGWLGTLFSRRRPAIACVCARYPVSRMASQDVDG